MFSLFVYMIKDRIIPDMAECFFLFVCLFSMSLHVYPLPLNCNKTPPAAPLLSIKFMQLLTVFTGAGLHVATLANIQSESA